MCETLTETFWRTYKPHPWRGDPYVPTYVNKLRERLEEIVRIRVTHENYSKLLTGDERQYMNQEQAFQPFAGLNAVHYNPFTLPLWNAGKLLSVN